MESRYWPFGFGAPLNSRALWRLAMSSWEYIATVRVPPPNNTSDKKNTNSQGHNTEHAAVLVNSAPWGCAAHRLRGRGWWPCQGHWPEEPSRANQPLEGTVRREHSTVTCWSRKTEKPHVRLPVLERLLREVVVGKPVEVCEMGFSSAILPTSQNPEGKLCIWMWVLF